PEVLRRLGWHYARVHAFELFTDPDAVADRIARMVGLAAGPVTEEVPIIAGHTASRTHARGGEASASAPPPCDDATATGKRPASAARAAAVQHERQRRADAAGEAPALVGAGGLDTRLRRCSTSGGGGCAAARPAGVAAPPRGRGGGRRRGGAAGGGGARRDGRRCGAGGSRISAGSCVSVGPASSSAVPFLAAWRSRRRFTGSTSTK